MIEVFKTNVKNKKDANRIISILNSMFEKYSINFDLEDCDKILRIENNYGVIDISIICELLKNEGVFFEVLPD